MILSVWLLLSILNLTRFSQISSASIPGNCTEALRLSRRSEGVHKIRVPGSHLKPFDVYCLGSKTNGTAYTIIQRRRDGKTDFRKRWVDYVRGFGNLNGDFFIGLEKLHELTKSSVGDLLIQMEDFDNNEAWARYTDFVIGNETESFALKSLGSYEGDAGDSLSVRVGYNFSTKDVDNGPYKGICFDSNKGGWWYSSCYSSNLNGRYKRGISEEGVVWYTWKNEPYSLKYVHMAIRDIPHIPTDCREALRFSGRPYGTFKIRNPTSEPSEFYCQLSENDEVYSMPRL